MLNCKSKSEGCRVPEKSHNMEMHGLGDHLKKKVTCSGIAPN